MWSRRGRLVLPALGVLALVGLVAVAATGSTELGTGGVRVSTVDRFLDVVLSLSLVAFVLGAVLLVYGLTQRRAVAEEYARQRRRSRSALVFAIGVIAFTALTVRQLGHLRPAPTSNDQTLIPGKHSTQVTPGRLATQHESWYQPHFAWIPVLVVSVLLALGFGAMVLSERRRRAGVEKRQALGETVAEVLDETLDDLLAEADPRRAVIAAYARLERALAAHGLPRKPAETAEEYLARILVSLEVGAAAIRRLTDLFTRAKFSQHEVDEAMKLEAIGALTAVRDQLRAAQAHEESERPARWAAAERMQ